MKTALVVCADDVTTVSHQFVDTLLEQGVAEVVTPAGFGELEVVVRGCEADQVVVFPAVIGLSDERLKDLVSRVDVLNAEGVDVFLANPLGSDPRLVDMACDRLSTALKATQDTPILTVEGVDGVQALNFDTFAGLPEQIADVQTVVPDRRGQGVWVRAVLPEVPNAEAVFFADDDRFSSTVSLDLVRAQGLFIYAMDGEPLPASYGGPLRLLIPGYDDRCANVKGVARVEIREVKA